MFITCGIDASRLCKHGVGADALTDERERAVAAPDRALDEREDVIAMGQIDAIGVDGAVSGRRALRGRGRREAGGGEQGAGAKQARQCGALTGARAGARAKQGLGHLIFSKARVRPRGRGVGRAPRLWRPGHRPVGAVVGLVVAVVGHDIVVDRAAARGADQPAARVIGVGDELRRRR